MDKIIFCERLNELLLDNQLTVKKISEKLNLNIYNVYHWLSGKVNYMPTISSLLKLADYFECSVDYLIGTENENHYTGSKEKTAFTQWFRKAVESKGFTLHALGKATQLSTSNFYKWINGEREPSLDSLMRIAAVLNCSLDYLLGREN